MTGPPRPAADRVRRVRAVIAAGAAATLLAAWGIVAGFGPGGSDKAAAATPAPVDQGGGVPASGGDAAGPEAASQSNDLPQVVTRQS